MKQLYESDGYVIAIRDPRNYVVYDETKPIKLASGEIRYDFKYHNTL